MRCGTDYTDLCMFVHVCVAQRCLRDVNHTIETLCFSPSYMECVCVCVCVCVHACVSYNMSACIYIQPFAMILYMHMCRFSA